MGERFEPYSVRQRRKQQAGEPVTYQYNWIPDALRAQVMNGLRLASRAAGRNSETYWRTVESLVAIELGSITARLDLWDGPPQDRIMNYIERVQSVDHFLDAVEFALRTAYGYAEGRSFSTEREEAQAEVNHAVDYINYRFNLHNVGYQYAGSPGEFIRLDTQYVHAEAIEPAIMQLHDAGWKGPEDEFLSAHRHYRRGEHKAAMNDALKAFESTMKAILTQRGWDFDPNWQAFKLVDCLIKNELIPRPLEAYMNGIRSVLESGVPMLRNRLSGHGQGTDVTEVPAYVAAFTLNLTASNIVFLTEANAAFDKRT